MIASVHLADVGTRTAVGLVLRGVDATSIPGMVMGEVVSGARLSPRVLPSVQPGRVGLIAHWDDDIALDRFLEHHPLGPHLGGGWHVRLRPLQTIGAWPTIPDAVDADGADGRRRSPEPEPGSVAVLTLGWLRLTRAAAFLRASAAAERDVLEAPGLLAATGLARPPHLVCTFSLWRNAAAMRAFTHRRGGGHPAAVASDHREAFHHESAFLRFRPYRSTGAWDGRDPLSSR